jgi:tyrosine kinase 3/solute carrier family 25 phosphate transporter 23/24/25/41
MRQPTLRFNWRIHSRLSAICYLLSAIGYRLLAIGYWLSAIGYRLLAICYWLSALGYRLSAIGYRLSAIGYWLLAIGYRGPAIHLSTVRAVPIGLIRPIPLAYRHAVLTQARQIRDRPFRSPISNLPFHPRCARLVHIVHSVSALQNMTQGATLSSQ